MPSKADLEDVKKVIRAVLISNPERRMTIKSLTERYKLLENDEVPFRQFGCSSLYDFLLTIPDTIKLLDRRDRNSFIEPVINEQIEHVYRLVRCQKPRNKNKRSAIRSRARRPSFRVYPPISNCSMNTNTVSQKSVDVNPLATHSPKEIPIVLICRLVKLLRTNEYIQSGSLFETYKKLYSERLRPESFGFTSEEKLLQHLRSTFMVDEINSNLSFSENVAREPFLSEVCGGDFDLETDPSFEKLKQGDKFDVNLGEIHSLDEFYIMFSSKVKLLDHIIVELDEFYKNNEERYKISSSSVSSNLLCACPYSENSQWHRACVLSYSHSLKSAKVIFVDYGTTEIVSIHKLRYLHKNFAKYPSFCSPARLSGIRPLNKQGYDDLAHLEFRRLYGDRDLEAEVVRKTSRHLEIFLYASNGNCKTAVHEELISKDLVLPSQEELMLKESSISNIIDEIMLRLTATSKSSLVSPEPPKVVSSTPIISPPPPPPPLKPIPSFPKGAQTPTYVCYPPQMVGGYSFPFGTYSGNPLFMSNPRPPYPFIPPFQNSGYLSPYQPSFPAPQYPYSGSPNLFRPPPGLSLPSFPAQPRFRRNSRADIPSSKLFTDVSQSAAAYSRDQVKSTISLSSNDVRSNDDAKSCLIDDQAEESNENDVPFHRSSDTNEEIILKGLEEFPIPVNKGIFEQEALKNELYEYTVRLREDSVRETDGQILNSSWERTAAERKLKEYLELDEDGEDEVNSADSKSSSSTKLNVLACEFTPKTKPRTSSAPTTNTNALCTTPENLSSTRDCSVEKLKQLRAFVLEHQTKK